MKFGLFLTILFIMSINITSNINSNKENISPHPFDFDIEGATSQDSIFEIIRSTKGNIFTHMRSVKKDFHPDIQHIFEKSIKEYEYRYISDKEDFVSFIFDRYQEMQYFEKDIEIKFKEETFDFIKDFLKLYHNFNEKEKKEFLKFIEKQHKFTRDILEFGIKHHIAFDDSRFKDLKTIVSTIPEMLFGNQNLNKLKNIKGKVNMKGQEIIIPKNETKSTNKMKKPAEPKIQENQQTNFLNQNNFLKNSTKHNETKKQKDFSFKSPEMNINHNFSKFINSVTNEYNLTHLHNQEHPTELKKLIFENLSTSMKDHHKKSFSIFLQEYIKESAYNNDVSLVTQYNSHKEDYFNDYDLSRFKSEESNRQDDDDDSPPPSPTASTDTMAGGTEVSAKIKGIKVAKEKVEDIKRKKIIAGFGKQPTCDVAKKTEEIKQLLTAKAEEIEKKTAGVESILAEIPSDLLKIGGDFDGIEGILKKIITKFISKVAETAVSHMPFFFFKFCIPPGPLTFGCCPEASFFPTQIYNLFTVFDKVEKFKTMAKNFPDWLGVIGNQWFPEPLYYICLQGYLTMHESALFNICDPLSLIFMNPLNLMGLLPGDMPVCFVSCIQAMVTCLTPPWNLGPCDSLINIFNLIAAIFDISARFRLMGAFIGKCSYIPFLIRWDLVADWKPKNEAHYDDPLAMPESGAGDSEPNCEIPPDNDPKSPFEEDLPADVVNQIKASVPPIFTPPPMGERGFRTKKSSFTPVIVDIWQEAKVGVKLQTDTSRVFYNPLYDEEFVDMISTESDLTSPKKLKRFPFHIKTYLIEMFY